MNSQRKGGEVILGSAPLNSDFQLNFLLPVLHAPSLPGVHGILMLVPFLTGNGLLRSLSDASLEASISYQFF